MGDWELSEIISLVLTTGVVTAVINQLLGGWLAGRRQRSEQTHQRALQAEQRNHEQQLRIEAAHAKAREDFLEGVAGALDWLNYEWGKHHGLDADWVPDHDPTPSLTSVTEVIEALRRVELRHPTRRVRELSTELRQGVSGHYGAILTVWSQDGRDPEQVVGTEPSYDDFAKWVQTGESLIDAIHEPPLISPALVLGGDRP